MQNSLNNTPKKKSGILPILIGMVIGLLIAAGVFAIVVFTKSDEPEKTEHIEEATDEKFVGSRVIFIPDVADLEEVTDKDIEQAMDVIANRLDGIGVTNKKIERQGDYAIKVEIPNVDDPNEVVTSIGQTAALQFMNANGEVVMEGDSEHVKEAEAVYGRVDDYGNQGYYVQLTLTDKGREKFKEATQNAVALAGSGMNFIAICMDGVPYSVPSVNEVIDSDTCVITGDFTKEEAEELASVINAGRLPFNLKCSEMVSIME